MPRQWHNSRQPSLSAGIFALLLFVIFFTELAMMELIYPVLSTFDVVIASLADAALLALVSIPAVYFLIVRPLFERAAAEHSEPVAVPVTSSIGVLAVIFLAEFLVSFLQGMVLPHAGAETRNLVDAGLTTLLCAPLLWWLLCRRSPDGRRIPLADLLGTPLQLYVLLLFMVFLVDMLEMFTVPLFFSHFAKLPYQIVDAFLTTLIIAPFLWWLMVRPLKRKAISEKVRGDALQSQLVDAIITINGQGLIESFNPAAEQIFGYAAAGITGQSAAVLFCDVLLCPDELALLAEGNTGVGGDWSTHEVTCRRRDGSRLTVEMSVSRILLEGKEQFLVIMRDITARKATEEALRDSESRFRQIYEQSEDAIVFFKPGTDTIIDANATAEKLFRTTKAELRAGGVELLCRGDEAVRLRNFISKINQSGMGRVENFVHRHQDGTERTISLRGKVMTIQGVNIVYCSFRDISERMRIEEKVQDIQAKLIQANKMTSLGLMVSGVAHEINNPNNFIMANSQLLARMWEDAVKILRENHQGKGDFLIGGLPFSEMEQHGPQLFAGIIDGSNRINAIVNNLKSFARQDRRVEMNGDLDVNEVVASAVAILQHQLSKYTEKFHLDLAENIPRIKGNHQQLGQVIINLLMNAGQALPARSRGIWVATGFDAAAGMVSITVRDEGGGMSQEIAGRIMEPFFTTKLDSGGTGLGLSISSSIIKEHHGSLEFASEPGNGTTFIVRLPAAEPAAEGSAP